MKEIADAPAPQAFLRDQVAAIYNKTGTVRNGEAVQVLGRDRRFARVRTSAGVEGWLEQRYLVSKQTYDALQKLAEQVAQRSRPGDRTGPQPDQHSPAAGSRDCRPPLPGGTGRQAGAAEARQQREAACPADKPESALPGKQGTCPHPPPLPWKTGWLIRDEPGHAGWVLGRMLDVDIPLEIAQYAEGQRAVACLRPGPGRRWRQESSAIPCTAH